MTARSPPRLFAHSIGCRGAVDTNAPALTLHTIQTWDAYETLRCEGTLSGDPALGDADFAEAYHWMRRQMANRLQTAGAGILWLWAKTNFRDLIGNTRSAQKRLRRGVGIL